MTGLTAVTANVLLSSHLRLASHDQVHSNGNVRCGHAIIAELALDKILQLVCFSDACFISIRR